MNKKYVLLILGFVVLLGFFLTLLFNKESNKEPLNLRDSSLGQAIYLKDYYLGNQTATTSPTYLTSSIATSSLVYNTSAADLISIDINLKSSTTPPTLYWVHEFSHNLIDWSPETGTTIDSSSHVTHNSVNVINAWTMATTSQTNSQFLRKSISVEPIASQFTRTRFWVSGAAADVWAHVIVRERR